MNKTIGIVGGMGPMATCDLFRKIVEIEEAASDQEHVRVCIDSNTEIPDRTAAILRGGVDPLKQMLKSAFFLQSMGADVLIMPCNTAHYFYEKIRAFIDAPFLNMLEETAKTVRDAGIGKVGLLATDGTIRSGVYAKAFSALGVRVEVPSAARQTEVMKVIYQGVKAGNADMPVGGLKAAVSELRGMGAETIILGCTELPIAYDLYRLDFPHVDPTLVLACRAVEFVGGQVKQSVKYSF